MIKCKNIIKLIKNYIKHPYIFLDSHNYTFEDHAHICLPLRLLGNDFKDVCQYYHEEYFDMPEWSDYCDKCKYLSIIEFNKDTENNKNISFVMHDSIVECFENMGD